VIVASAAMLGTVPPITTSQPSSTSTLSSAILGKPPSSPGGCGSRFCTARSPPTWAGPYELVSHTAQPHGSTRCYYAVHKCAGQAAAAIVMVVVMVPVVGRIRERAHQDRCHSQQHVIHVGSAPPTVVAWRHRFLGPRCAGQQAGDDGRTTFDHHAAYVYIHNAQPVAAQPYSNTSVAERCTVGCVQRRAMPCHAVECSAEPTWWHVVSQHVRNIGALLQLLTSNAAADDSGACRFQGSAALRSLRGAGRLLRGEDDRPHAVRAGQ
jgi:hypothetical protein